MIYNPVKNMVACGVCEILVVTSSRHMGDIVASLGSGEEFGADFTYKVQEEARGIADALRLGRRFAGDESVFVLLGDNIFDSPLTHFTANYRELQKELGARVMLVEVDDPTSFGVAALDEKKVVEIQEKPEKPKSNYAVVGAYLYDSQVWEIIEHLRPSKRGEYEITDVNNAYISKAELEYDFVRGMWMDTGTFESYHRANEILFSRMKEEHAK
jgi:glucose-1-phosphate thymidylyltransferase